MFWRCGCWLRPVRWTWSAAVLVICRLLVVQTRFRHWQKTKHLPVHSWQLIFRGNGLALTMLRAQPKNPGYDEFHKLCSVFFDIIIWHLLYLLIYGRSCGTLFGSPPKPRIHSPSIFWLERCLIGYCKNGWGLEEAVKSDVMDTPPINWFRYHMGD